MMQAIIIVFRFFFGGKELKIAGGILLALIILPAMAVVVIASTPQALLDQLFAGSRANAEAYTSTVNPAPEGVKILADYTYPGDNYAPGNCTYWVFARRAMVGLAIPNTFGNANTWDDRARNQGYVVDHVPAQYAIMQTDRGNLGHVAFVESVDLDGTWHISEMNVLGLFIVDHKSFPASAAASYTFIHNKGL